MLYTNIIRYVIDTTKHEKLHLPTCDEWTFHPYQMGESTLNFRVSRSDFSILFHFTMKLIKANRIAPDANRIAPEGAILFAFVPKKDTRLIWVKRYYSRVI